MSLKETDQKRASDQFEEAFDRLLHGESRNLPSGAPVNLSNVAKEAGKSPSALRRDRYPDLIQRIKLHMASEKEVEKFSAPARKRNRSRRIEQRLADCSKERDRLQSICHSQQTLIDELRDEIHRLENGNNVLGLPNRQSSET